MKKMPSTEYTHKRNMQLLSTQMNNKNTIVRKERAEKEGEFRQFQCPEKQCPSLAPGPGRWKPQ